MKKSTKATQSAAVETSNNSSQNVNQNTAPDAMATPHKQQTAKEAIATNVQLLIEQLEQGHSEGLTRLPDRDVSFSSVFLWQHFRDCETEACDIVLYLAGVSKHRGLRIAGVDQRGSAPCMDESDSAPDSRKVEVCAGDRPGSELHDLPCR